MIMASRVVYGMADQGVLPALFSRVHPGRLTPWVSILFTTIVVLLLLAFILVNSAVFVLRSDEVEQGGSRM